MKKNDKENEKLLDHLDDDPFADLPEINASDEEVLAMYDDEKYLKFSREHIGANMADEEFADYVAKRKRQLVAAIAENEEYADNG